MRSVFFAKAGVSKVNAILVSSICAEYKWVGSYVLVYSKKIPSLRYNIVDSVLRLEI